MKTLVVVLALLLVVLALPLASAYTPVSQLQGGGVTYTVFGNAGDKTRVGTCFVPDLQGEVGYVDTVLKGTGTGTVVMEMYTNTGTIGNFNNDGCTVGLTLVETSLTVVQLSSLDASNYANFRFLFSPVNIVPGKNYLLVLYFTWTGTGTVNNNGNSASDLSKQNEDSFCNASTNPALTCDGADNYACSNGCLSYDFQLDGNGVICNNFRLDAQAASQLMGVIIMVGLVAIVVGLLVLKRAADYIGTDRALMLGVIMIAVILIVVLAAAATLFRGC